VKQEISVHDKKVLYLEQNICCNLRLLLFPVTISFPYWCWKWSYWSDWCV